MESKKINQLATELAPDLSDITIIGDPTTGISKKITLSQMASLFTGTVEEYANFAAFPLVGVADTIYIALDTNILYRWNTGTSAYVELSPNIVSSLVFNDANGFDGTINLVGSVATLTITTALTTGSVGFIGASGALLQDNANFFWDDTNNRLGLGTNAPTTALDVFGSGIIGRINGTSTNNAYLGFSSAGTNKWSVGNVQSDHRFRIFSEANSVELISVLQTGEFGIGIANPTTKFHIDGAASALIANLDANVSVAKSVSFRSDNSNRINLEVSGTESGSNAGANFFIRRYSDAGALIDTPFTIVRSTGTATFSTTVGIVTTPYAWVSTGRALQVGEYASISQQHNGSTNILSNAYESSSNTFKYTNTGSFPIRINLDPNDGSINFLNAPTGTSGNAITWSKKLSLLYNGILQLYRDGGAGFAISSAETNSSDIALGMSTSGGYAYIQSANSGTGSVQPLAFFVGATRVANFLSTGQVGIGVNTVDSTISVDIQNLSPSSNNVFLRIKNNNGSEDCGIKIAGTFGTAYEHTFGCNTLIASGDLVFHNANSLGYRWYVDGNEKMKLESSGRITINSSATYCLNVNHTNNASGTGAFVTALGSNANNTSSYHYIATTGGADKLYIFGNGNVQNINNSYGALSDIKLKENINDASSKLDKLMKVRIVNYNLIGEELRQIGVIAQELEQIFPSLIDETEDFKEVEVEDEEGNITKENEYLGTFTKSVKYSVFVPMLIKAMQEQQAQIEELKILIAAK
jgi:hypothetical protein